MKLKASYFRQYEHPSVPLQNRNQDSCFDLFFFIVELIMSFKVKAVLISGWQNAFLVQYYKYWAGYIAYGMVRIKYCTHTRNTSSIFCNIQHSPEQLVWKLVLSLICSKGILNSFLFCLHMYVVCTVDFRNVSLVCINIPMYMHKRTVNVCLIQHSGGSYLIRYHFHSSVFYFCWVPL